MEYTFSFIILLFRKHQVKFAEYLKLNWCIKKN